MRWSVRIEFESIVKVSTLTTIDGAAPDEMQPSMSLITFHSEICVESSVSLLFSFGVNEIRGRQSNPLCKDYAYFFLSPLSRQSDRLLFSFVLAFEPSIPISQTHPIRTRSSSRSTKEDVPACSSCQPFRQQIVLGHSLLETSRPKHPLSDPLSISNRWSCARCPVRIAFSGDLACFGSFRLSWRVECLICLPLNGNRARFANDELFASCFCHLIVRVSSNRDTPHTRTCRFTQSHTLL